MTALRILFLGGNGIISSAASRLAVQRGHDLTLLTRGASSKRPPIEGAQTLRGDAADAASVAAATAGREFDVVVNFQLFTGADAEGQREVFRGRVGQYVAISSAAAYGKPVRQWPIVESTALRNPFWQYARGKIEVEEVLTRAYRDEGFPITIVRPSHTYDPTLIALPGGWTTVDRMRRGLPIVIHGDGTSIWTLTHQRDFAVGLVGLLGLPAAVGESVHITGDELLTWDLIAHQLAAAAGVEASIVHIASERIARAIPEWREPLLGDWSHSEIYDNSKIKRLVPEFVATTPFARGAHEIVEWYDADESRRVVDEDLDRRIDLLVAAEG